MKTIIILIIVALVAWTVWSFYAYTVETLSYTVTEKKQDYEIRQYAPYIAMQTEVDGNSSEALNAGFRILANYIFGGNVAQQKVAMTAPVMENQTTPSPSLIKEGNNAKVAMTAPVMEQKSVSGKRIITFTAPKEYTINTLPKPNSDKIKFVQVPNKKYAVHKFTWYYTADRIEEKKKYLLESLQKDNVKTLGEPMFAGYNGPGTMPFLIRNEILIEIE
jgi:SOUL heme-binding protein